MRYPSSPKVKKGTVCRLFVTGKMCIRDRLKIYEIAEYLGFKNAFYFNRVFKKMEGISPSEYALREMMESA